MNEEEARGWIFDRFGIRGLQAMETLVSLVTEENRSQNLIAPSTLDSIWGRHIVDSAQLTELAADMPGTWLDIGTGAGFPGLVVAALTDRVMTFAEPRKRRADFLRKACEELRLLPRVTIVAAKVGTIAEKFNVISARAVASLPDILFAAQQCSTWNTLWLLPKGRRALEEIVNTKKAWHAAFHVEHSLTDHEAMIVTATRVQPR